MTNPKRKARALPAADQAATANAVADVMTSAIGAVTTPTLDIEKPAGTIDAAPPAPAEPEAAPEPITKPNGGGSFVRDRATGHLTLQEA
jgi:hypothetical protein